MKTLPEQVETAVRDQKLLRHGDSLLVAVSGGVDSMVLLQVLHGLAVRHHWRLSVAHYNHRLRGRSSDADQRLVQRTAKALGLRFAGGAGNVRAFARKRGDSLEMAARTLRHQFLARTATRLDCRVIALAHHRDDQAELVLLRLFRGAGADGLAGMKWRSPAPADPKITLVRPLLEVGKAELLAYAKANHLAFREDATNVSTDHQRNGVRCEILPIIRKHFPGDIAAHLARAAEIIRGESAVLDAQTRRWRSHRRPAFARLPRALQRRVIQSQMQALGLAPTFDSIEALCSHANRAVSVAGQWLKRDANGVVHSVRQARAAFDVAQMEVLLSRSRGTAKFEEATLEWEKANATGTDFAPRPDCEHFDAARIGAKLVLRHWQPGDRFQPIGFGHEIKLQDWFTNGKIPRAARHRLVVATDAAGAIFWVEGQRIGERAKLTPETQKRLIWRWKRPEIVDCG